MHRVDVRNDLYDYTTGRDRVNNCHGTAILILLIRHAFKFVSENQDTTYSSTKLCFWKNAIYPYIDILLVVHTHA